MKLAFLNTYKLVVPTDEFLIRYLIGRGLEVDYYVLNVSYRALDKSIDKFYKRIKVPKFVPHKKTFLQIYFGIIILSKAIYKRYDAYILFSQPPLFYLLVTKILRIRKIRYFLYIQDLHPDLLDQTFNWLPLKNVLYNLSNVAFKNSCKIIVIGRCMEERLIKRGISKEKIMFIPNTTYYNNSTKISDRYLTEKYEFLKDKFIVLYLGNMGVPHILSTLLRVASNFNTNRNEIHFLFIGNGKRRKEIETFKNDNITLLDKLEDYDFNQITKRADCHFISLRNEYTGISVPSKFYTALASGSPIIFEGSRSAEIGKMIVENKIGQVVEPFDELKLQNAIEVYANDKQLLDDHSFRAEKLFMENYTEEKLRKNYYKNFYEVNFMDKST